MTERRAKALQEQYKDLLMTDFEVEVKERTQRLEHLLRDLDKDHDKFAEELQKTEEYLQMQD